MPLYFTMEQCAIALSLLPDVKESAYVLGDYIEQSPNGFVFLAGLWHDPNNTLLMKNETNYYRKLGLSRPNTNIPVVFNQELNGVDYIHVYCPNSTKLWQVRKVWGSNHPDSLCPSRFIEGHLKIPFGSE